jgi:hypothetical protein
MRSMVEGATASTWLARVKTRHSPDASNKPHRALGRLPAARLGAE